LSDLRVAYDMTFPNRNQGGTGEYARELLRALCARGDVDLVPIAGPARSGMAATALWLGTGARRDIRRAGADVLHCPALVIPLRPGAPLVVTAHDDGVSRYPGGHPLEWRLFTRHVLPRLARRAEAVITPSEFVRGELVTSWRLDPARVAAIPHGVSEAFAAPAGGRAASRARPRLLFPGAPIERKNLGLVLDALASAAAGSPLRDAELVISSAEARSFPSQAAHVARLGLDERVRWLGVLPRQDVPALYREVDVLVYPSLYEGFGLPPLEAMAAGTPVVAARAACLPETLSDAAVLVDPHDAGALAAAVESLLTDTALRASMIAAGRARAATFTWERSAAATANVYRAVAARR
jgi:glycosyltransferase involved in cell wall biosynthesis